MLRSVVSIPLIHELVEYHRNFDCPQYRVCLDVAAALNWPSFSCSMCSDTKGPDAILLAEYRRREEFDASWTGPAYKVWEYSVPLVPYHLAHCLPLVRNCFVHLGKTKESKKFLNFLRRRGFDRYKTFIYFVMDGLDEQGKLWGLYFDEYCILLAEEAGVSPEYVSSIFYKNQEMYLKLVQHRK